MSRSRKKSPFTSRTTSVSEKEDKRLYNRRYRHVVKQLMHIDPTADILPHLRDYSNPWAMDKDGKWLFDPKKYPQFLRK